MPTRSPTLDSSVALCIAFYSQKGVAMHEFAHAMGVIHEQSRPDRDKYVKILWNNIKPNLKHNFKIHYQSYIKGHAYDYKSIMHYGDKVSS